MPDCHEKQNIVPHLYGEGTAEERQHFEEHLTVCASCAEEFEAFADVGIALGSWTPENAEAPRSIVARVREFLGLNAATLHPAWSVAVVAALVLVVTVSVTQNQPWLQQAPTLEIAGGSKEMQSSEVGSLSVPGSGQAEGGDPDVEGLTQDSAGELSALMGLLDQNVKELSASAEPLTPVLTRGLPNSNLNDSPPMSLREPLDIYSMIDVEDLRGYAEQGDALAQYNLGVLYELGEDLPEDHVEAVQWYRLAAEQGVFLAQFKLGLLYALGKGAETDPVNSHTWLTLAASQSPGEFREQLAQALEILARAMTPAQIAEAQRLAREWDAAHPREP